VVLVNECSLNPVVLLSRVPLPTCTTGAIYFELTKLDKRELEVGSIIETEKIPGEGEAFV